MCGPLTGCIDPHTVKTKRKLIDGPIVPPAATKGPINNRWHKQLPLRQRRAAARGAESGLGEVPR